MTARNSVPFLDLRRINGRFDSAIEAALGRVIASGRYLLGDETRAFAREFATFAGSRCCVPVGNGLDALSLTLRAWVATGRLAPGDEVIVPANSFIASALAVTQAGLEVVVADVEPSTMCVTVETLRAVRSARTRVVMPVHLYGQMADTERVSNYARAEGLLVLQDAAQAHGAASGGRPLGSLGDAAAFSFYPAKNLGALGDAGCVVTDDAVLADEIAMLANYGSRRKYHHEQAGVNSRMDEANAAVLRIKLPFLDADNDHRRRIAGRYLAGIRHPGVLLPKAPSDERAHVWHLFVIRTTHRDDLAAWLDSAGIETLIHYPTAIHRQPAYAATLSRAHAPMAERLQAEVLSLPISPVMSNDDADHVVATLNAWPMRADAPVHGEALR